MCKDTWSVDDLHNLAFPSRPQDIYFESTPAWAYNIAYLFFLTTRSTFLPCLGALMHVAHLCECLVVVVRVLLTCKEGAHHVNNWPNVVVVYRHAPP